MALRRSQIDKFRHRVADRPWLHLLESGDVPEALNELDPDLFVVFNTKKRRFELHEASVPLQFRNLSYVLSADELDMRIYYRVINARIELDPVKKAELESAYEAAQADKRFANNTNAFARDLADAVSIDLDGQRVFPSVKPRSAS